MDRDNTKPQILEHSATQDLNLGALSSTTTFRQPYALRQVLIHFTGGTVSQTVTVTLDSRLGAAFDTILDQTILAGESNYAYFPDGEVELATGDEILVQCTNTGTPARVANLSVKGEQR